MIAYPNWVYEFTITPNITKKWTTELQGVVKVQSIADIKDIYFQSMEIAKIYLPSEIIYYLNCLTLLDYVNLVIIRGLPTNIDINHIGLSIADIALLGCSELCGSVITYDEEPDGIIQNVKTNYKSINISTGIKGKQAIDYHIEADFLSHIDESIVPECLSFLGIVNNNHIQTKFLRIIDIVRLLSENDILNLQKNEFQISPPQILGQIPNSLINIPVLSEDKIGSMIILASPNATLGINSIAQSSLDKLRITINQFSQQNYFSIPIKPGVGVFFNQNRVLHARDTVIGMRWLKRAFILREIDLLPPHILAAKNIRSFSLNKLLIK